jgi:hypothetical protein
VAARRLDLLATRGVPVVLGGSLMTARDPLLSQTISDQLTAGLPGAEIRIVDVPPVAGAALLGLDHVGAGPAAAAHLRESARTTWPTRQAESRAAVMLRELHQWLAGVESGEQRIEPAELREQRIGPAELRARRRRLGGGNE